MDHPDKSDIDKNEERRKRVFVGKLPTDFLRVDNEESHSPTTAQQLPTEARAALTMLNYKSEKIIGELSVNVAQAKLVKNYGITRMDPYVTMGVGNYIYETQVDVNGGKNPKWNRVFQCRLASDVYTMNLKIYDQCSLKVDELIAWAEIVIPPSVLAGDQCDDWFPLSGRQGDRVEGMINLIMNFTPGDDSDDPGPIGSFVMRFPTNVGMPNVGMRNYYPSSASLAQSPPIERTILYCIRDLEQVEEMFPNIDKEVVKSVFESNAGNKDLTVNALLQMTG